MATKRQSLSFLVKQPKSLPTGFTLLETLVVVAIIASLAAIAASSWLYLLSVLNLNTAQDEILQAMRKAQQNARLHRIVWQFTIRQTSDGQVQWAISPSKSDTTEVEITTWRTLASPVQLDQRETTLLNVNGTHRVQFNHLGAVNGRLGRVTLSLRGSSKTKRCVIVSTLLGALRSGSNQSRAENGRYCR